MTDPSQRTEQDKKAIESALKLIRSIDALAKDQDFLRFVTPHTQRADDLARSILHDKMSPEDREAMRNRRLGMMDVLLSLQQDRAGQVGVLARYGIQAGDENLTL